MIARIPGDKRQEEALEIITFDNMSYRDASAWIQDEFMLRLKDAPFPTGDDTLKGKSGSLIGPCTTCRKRTGNQPELFGDVQSADVCTDPDCFKGKVVAFGQRLLDEAVARGQRIIVGPEAEKAAPDGAARSYARLVGWHRLDEKNWSVGKTIKQLVGKKAERALLQCPKTGAVIEVVSAADVRKALGLKRAAAASSDPYRAAQRKAKIERKYRSALYEQCRDKLGVPALPSIALRLWAEMQHETRKLIATLQGWETKQLSMHSASFVTKIEALKGKDLGRFLNDCIYAADLHVSPHMTSKPTLLLEAAKAAGIDAAAVRRSVTPKRKKAKKKAAKAKPAKKRATKKKRATA